jgi:hypothetical protein
MKTTKLTKTRLFAIALFGAVAASPAAANEVQIEYNVSGTAEFSLSYDQWYYDNYAVLNNLAAPYDYTTGVSGTIYVSDNGYWGSAVGLFDNHYTIYGPASPPSFSGIDSLLSLAAPETAVISITGETGKEFVQRGDENTFYIVSAVYQVDSVSVPEPPTWAMMGLGFAGLAFAGYRTARPGRALIA